MTASRNTQLGSPSCGGDGSSGEDVDDEHQDNEEDEDDDEDEGDDYETAPFGQPFELSPFTRLHPWDSPSCGGDDEDDDDQ